MSIQNAIGLSGTDVATAISRRITSIDAVRGLVMVIMALDHVRDLFHYPAMEQDPTDLNTTTVPLFLTRWITHLCAPTFVFLSGTSAYLSLQKRNDETARPNRTGGPAARWFLLKRGLVLMLLEVTLINFAFWFEFPFRVLMLQVIFAIGAGLVMLSFLSRLPVRWVGLLGLLIVAGHDLLLRVPPFADPMARFGYSLLFRTEFLQITPNFAVLTGYPLVPWLGILLVGYGAGPLFGQPPARRKRMLLCIGLGALGLFVALRLLNGYGDIAPWSVQRDAAFTALSFLNVSKYPPSLLYCLLMLGIALVVLSLVDGVSNVLTRLLLIYGAVPMFYYILHWYLIHGLMLVMVVMQGYTVDIGNTSPFSFGRPQGTGVSLEIVYLVWIGVVALLYPLCRWYGRYKAAHPEIAWLRYV